MEVLYFSARWCGPCLAYKPLLAKVLVEYPDVKVVEYDVDDHFEIAFKHQIREIPALVVPGNTIKLIGAADEASLRSWLNTVTGR